MKQKDALTIMGDGVLGSLYLNLHLKGSSDNVAEMESGA